MSLLLALVGGGGGTSYTITALAGSYTYTGVQSPLKVGRNVVANSGTYSYTGASSNLKISRLLTANSGTYSYAGQSANLVLSGSQTNTVKFYTHNGIVIGNFIDTSIFVDKNNMFLLKPISSTFAIVLDKL